MLQVKYLDNGYSSKEDVGMCDEKQKNK